MTGDAGSASINSSPKRSSRALARVAASTPGRGSSGSPSTLHGAPATSSSRIGRKAVNGTCSTNVGVKRRV